MFGGSRSEGRLASVAFSNVAARRLDLVFILCYFITGLLDSSAYNAWTCFVSMQTGNTVFIGLGASSQPVAKPEAWINSLVSVASFLSGSTIFSHLAKKSSRQRRTLFLSFLAQTLCIAIAAVLLNASVIPDDADYDGHLQLIPIFLLSFQAGGQMAASRGVGLNELPTTVITSVYYDIVSDEKLLASPADNVKRNRRLGGVVALIIGAIAGGWCNRFDGGLTAVFWIATGLKALITAGWLVWEKEEEELS